ncbi:MAG: hypothetical protein U5O39_15495 [Gammaproteobacteria bacterium]|nr:hypothetical protein [Gammaproteobacteria bacterium]
MRQLLRGVRQLSIPPRPDLGLIAERLADFGASVVVLDFLMDFRSSYGEDEPTAAMFEEAGNVILVSYANFADGECRVLTYPTAKLDAATRSGYSNLEPTSAIIDNLARLRVHKEITSNRDGYPVAIQALAAHLDAEPAIEGDSLVIGDLRTPLDHVRRYLYRLPPARPWHRYPASRATGIFGRWRSSSIEDNLPPRSSRRYRYVFEDRDRTWSATPGKSPRQVQYADRASLRRRDHRVTIIHTLLNDAPLRPASMIVESAATGLFLIALLATSAFASLWAARALLVYVVYIGAATALYVSSGLVISMSYAMVAGLLAMVFMSIRFYVLTERQQHEVRGRFSGKQSHARPRVSGAGPAGCRHGQVPAVPAGARNLRSGLQPGPRLRTQAAVQQGAKRL